MNILAISGSLRGRSSNAAILHFMATLFPDNVRLSFFEGIATLPHFTTDLDNGNSPETVTQWRQALKEADAVLICTPEYAQGVPGSLKNALDWIVSSGELVQKPTALITASLLGEHAHASLLLTLNMMMAAILPEATFVIPQVSQKMDKETGAVTDLETLAKIRTAVEALQNAVPDKVA